MSDEVTFRPVEHDIYGGKRLEYVVRKTLGNNRRWGIYARTESYGWAYYIAAAWKVTRPRSVYGRTRIGWERKRDALAYLATIQPVKE